MDSKAMRKRLFRLARPIFFETLLLMSLGMIDVFMLSQISDASVAAVGLVNQILNMIFLVFIVGATGSLVVCSQYLGAKRPGDFLVAARVSMLLNAAIGLIVSLLLFFGAQTILEIMDAKADLLENATNYCEIVGGFAFLVALTFAATSILRAREMAQYPMYVSLITNIVNIIGNYLLIFGHMGFPALAVEGAAWATVVSRLAGLILLLFFLAKRGLRVEENGAAHAAKKLCADALTKLLQILRIGIPGAGEMFSYASSQVVITYFINMLGTDALAARTYMMNIVICTFIFAISIAQAASVSCGHLVGKHSFAAAKALGSFAINRALLISGALSLLLALLAPLFMPVMTENQHILSLCLTLFWIDILLELGRAVNILTGRLLSAVGDPLFPLKVSIIVVWSVATLGGYIAGITLGFGLIGMWTLFLIDECLRASIQWHYWRTGRWMNKSIC
ncbi:MAG: MATE family efflux transporter [Desulfovibrionaceae bacterium]|nr:MATE family efflux transporter [Desulfovibrionaceae bacterium]